MPYPYEKLTLLPTKEKFAHFVKNEKLFHIIFAEQFDRKSLEMLFGVATRLRKIAKFREGLDFLGSLLSHKSAMLYFTQPSTRTYLSFVRACQYLGMNYAEVRDPRISSAFKGETDIDGVRTFSNYFNLIIMRHEQGGFAEKVAYLMDETNKPIPVVSAGAGPDEHPTQALLDIYTLRRSFEKRTNGIKGINIAFMGDVARGRTVRSLAKLLTLYNGVNMTFVSPPQLRIKEDLKKWLDKKKAHYSETDDVNTIIKDVDAIYVTRIQDEYKDESISDDVDYGPYCLTMDHVDKMKPDAIVMHPLPRRNELDPKIDTDPRAAYWKQERNGMWIRAALVAYLFNTDSHILDYYSQHFNY